ncbi:hypothetical protein [Nostoc sp.]|uniref:hypothetical protein n=1 Tax=Nostoc sp. TaxID=1180 RepID=UPI002FF711DF
MNNLQNPEPDEFIHQVHNWEAKGYEREIEVHPNLWLSIYDTENYYDSLEKTSEWDHPVQFHDTATTATPNTADSRKAC